MNCATAREQLLGAERPDRPTEALTAHLTGCGECRAMQWRLERLERELPRLPVPPCPPPPALLEQLRHGPADGAVVRVPARAGRGLDRRQGGRQKLALAFALAASLAVFALSWGALSRQETPAAPTLEARYAQRLKGKLQPGLLPRERVARLTDLADELLEETKAAEPARLEEVAQQVEWLTTRDLPKQAALVPAADRAVVLTDAAARLRKLESLATKWQLKRKDERSAKALESIATSLDRASKHLREMAMA